MANSLSHHGIKGQKWGVRRFQNKDGSYTSAGRRRYNQPVLKRPGKSVSERFDHELASDIQKARNSIAYSPSERVDIYKRITNKLVDRMDKSAWLDDYDRIDVYKSFVEDVLNRINDVPLSVIWESSSIFDDD